jgi:hypothetical protein
MLYTTTLITKMSWKSAVGTSDFLLHSVYSWNEALDLSMGRECSSGQMEAHFRTQLILLYLGNPGGAEKLPREDSLFASPSRSLTSSMTQYLRMTLLL